MSFNNLEYLYKADNKIIKDNASKSYWPDIQKALINLFKLCTNKPYYKIILYLAADIYDKDKASEEPDNRLDTLAAFNLFSILHF
jgi:hypothetical protein